MSCTVSIIIPIYNAEKYLERCLESFRQQTFHDFEVIMIDDGSSDGSASICKSFSTRDMRFKYFYQDNSGVSAARNNGIQKAKGKYIGFCDSDDWVSPLFVEKLVATLKNSDADISICSYRIVDNNLDVFEKKQEIADLNDDNSIIVMNSKEAIIEMHRAKLYEGHLWNKFYKKELFDGIVMNTNISLFEDLLINWDLMINAKKIVYFDSILYYYTDNPNSALNKKYSKREFEKRNVCYKLFEKEDRAFQSEEVRFWITKTLISADLQIYKKMIMAGVSDIEAKKQIKEDINLHFSKELVDVLSTENRRLLKLAKCDMRLLALYVKFVTLASSLKRRVIRK